MSDPVWLGVMWVLCVHVRYVWEVRRGVDRQSTNDGGGDGARGHGSGPTHDETMARLSKASVGLGSSPGRG